MLSRKALNLQNSNEVFVYALRVINNNYSSCDQ